MGYGVVCQACGVEAPTKQVEFHQNIGALVMRFHNRVRGRLCKNCIHANFWKMTSITVLVGWLGVISIIIAPFFVLNNVIRYLGALGMPPVPEGARPPELTDEAIKKLEPHTNAIGERLGRDENLNDVAIDIAAEAGVTPGQVWAYVLAVAQAQAKARAPRVPVQQSTGGFPVIPLPIPANAPAAVAQPTPQPPVTQPPLVVPAPAPPVSAPAPSIGITE